MGGIDILVGCFQFCNGIRKVKTKEMTEPSDDCIWCNQQIARGCREKPCNELGIDSDQCKNCDSSPGNKRSKKDQSEDQKNRTVELKEIIKKTAEKKDAKKKKQEAKPKGKK